MSTTPDGDRLGEIYDIMLEKRSGNIAYAVMSFGGFLGIGERYHALPWATLKYDTRQGGYVVGLTIDQLKAAPTYAAFNALHARQEALEAKLRTAPADDIAVLHPNAAERYKEKVAEIHEALARGDAASREAIALVRNLVQEIVVRPKRMGCHLRSSATSRRSCIGNRSATPVRCQWLRGLDLNQRLQGYEERFLGASSSTLSNFIASTRLGAGRFSSRL
jgi:hypothetical protein